jgi:hypothetical protein
MTTQASVLQILANPFDYKWTIQGFGMLRTYLDSEHSERLHIWDPDIAVPVLVGNKGLEPLTPSV